MKIFLERMLGGRNRKKLILISFLFITVFLFLPLHHASAGWFDGLADAAGDIIFSAIFIFLQLLWWMASAFAYIGSYLVDVFLDPGLYASVLSDQNTAIRAGLMTVRDACYMFYIFFMLLIAFSTITRSQAYSAKNILPKIIISIFLINFSDVIAKVIIDFGQVFLFGIAGWMGTFSGTAGGSSGLMSVVSSLNDMFFVKFKQGNLATSDMMMIGFSIGYTWLLGASFYVLAGFLLLRLVMFVFLIIASPFAFFGMVLPETKGWYSKWTSELWKQTLSGPVLIFFVYFSAMMMQNLMKFSSTVEIQPNISFFGRMMSVIIPSIIPIVILYMAVPAANMVGGIGSKSVSNSFLGVKSMGMRSYAGLKLGKRMVDKGASMADAKLTGTNFKGYADTKTKAKDFISKAPLGVGRAYIELQTKNKAEMKQEVKQFEDAFANMTPEQMATYANSFTIDKEKGARAQQAMINTLMSKGKMSNADLAKAGFVDPRTKEFDKTKFQATMKTVENYGGDMSDVYKQRLDMVDPAKMEAELSKIQDKNELKNVKLDSALDDKTADTMRNLLGQEEYEKWQRGKSQGEKDSFIQQDEDKFVDNFDSGTKTLADIKGKQVEWTALSRSGDKVTRMSKVTKNTAGNIQTKVDATTGKRWIDYGTTDVDEDVAKEAVYKFDDNDFANFKPDDLKKPNMAKFVPNRGISAINKKGNKKQLDAVKGYYEDVVKGVAAPATAAEQKAMNDLIASNKKNIKKDPKYLGLSSDDQRNAVDKLRYIESNL
jgi:hypothetical protein